MWSLIATEYIVKICGESFVFYIEFKPAIMAAAKGQIRQLAFEKAAATEEVQGLDPQLHGKTLQRSAERPHLSWRIDDNAMFFAAKKGSSLAHTRITGSNVTGLADLEATGLIAEGRRMFRFKIQIQQVQ